MRIGIVGLGLIGGSLGAALCSCGHFVAGYDSNEEHAADARRRGLVDDVYATLAACVGPADVVVLATPLDSIVSLLPEVAGSLKPGAVVTDVSSVKQPVIEAMDQLPERVRAVGGHPIAGKESSGPRSSDAAIFEGAAYAVVPSARSDSRSIATVTSLARQLGSKPVRLSAAEHDALVARTSHLPQVVSSALAEFLGADAHSSLTGPGLRGMTRLADSNPNLWRQILVANGSNVAPELRQFAELLARWATAIEDADGTWVEQEMAAAKRIKETERRGRRPGP